MDKTLRGRYCLLSDLAARTQICLPRLPHRKKGRLIKPGQRIHASVAFIKSYTPKALIAMNAQSTITWDNILTSGRQDNLNWSQDILDMDLFDLESVPLIVDAIRADLNSTDLVGRLDFLALTRKGGLTFT